MARLTIYKDNNVNTTVVSNLFIDEYMQDANDAQLKVYLYLLRMMNAHQATSVSDIADKFNHTEKDVVRALKFWEKNRLLDLDYDEGKNLVGIHIRDLTASDGSSRRRNMSSSFIPVPSGSSVPSISSDASDSSIISVASAAQEERRLQSRESIHTKDTPSENPYEKPVYSADQLRAFKNRENTAQLLCITESYIGKPLTPTEIKTILFFSDVLHFSDDLIDYLVQYCVDRGKKDFKYIEKVAINWAEQGITTPKEAQEKTYLYDKNTYAIMRELGKNNIPTTREAEFITRWTKEYGFSNDIIFEACERTVLATDKNRFEYAERILRSWHDQNVHSKEDIGRIDEVYKQRKKSTIATNKTYVNRFNQFQQNTYDFDALERELLSN